MKSLYLKPKYRFLRLVFLFFLAVSILITLTPNSVKAQEGQIPQLVTAIMYFNDKEGEGCLPHMDLQIEIYNVGSQGGEAYSQAVYTFPEATFVNTSDGDIACVNTGYSKIYGTFTGGPNGTITFPDGNSESITTCQVIDGQTIECIYDIDLYDLGRSVFTWVYIIQNPEAFQTVVTPSITQEETEQATAEPTVEAVTSETIYNTYGIRVEDSFGDDQYEQASWTDEELGLLNDVLKELPPEMIKNMKIKSFIRNKVSIGMDGNQKPKENGTYFICEANNNDPRCDGNPAIRIYDNALIPTAENPDPAKKFKGTILHELIHSLQYNNTRDNPTDAYSTPLLYNYMDAVTTPNANGWDPGWEYKQAPGAPPPPKWQLTSSQLPPTSYGKLNPKEDMCESVKIYMYDPQKLKDSSPLRYAFIRDEMFGGVEYENGEQKK